MHKKEIFLEIDANLHQPIQSMEADSNSRAIRFYLTSNYAPLNLKDKKVIFKAVKPDSTDIVNDCEIIDVEKGIVETKVTKQLNAVPGRVNCQLSIIGANDYVLKTKKFGILVDSKLTESGIISSREYKTLENALSEVHEINKNFEQVNAKINEVATKGTTVEVIEEVTKEEIERQIADGTIAHLMIEDGSVTPEKTSFYDEIATQKNLLKNAEFDYMGNNQNTVKKAIDSSIDWVLGEVNTAHHEGQHITATDTIEGHAKSAILSGQTLVNLCNFKRTFTADATYSKNDDVITVSTIEGKAWSSLEIVVEQLKANTDYILMVDNVTYTHTDSFGATIAVCCRKGNVKLGQLSENSKFLKFNTADYDLSAVSIRIHATLTTTGIGTTTVKGVRVLEYQEGMENWDIPYFEGMQSVKMSVLTTTGKNLFNGVLEKGNYNGGTNNLKSSVFTLKELTKYTISNDKNYSANVVFHDDNNQYISEQPVSQLPTTFETPLGTKYAWIRTWSNQDDLTVKFQIEEGSVATPYEPYKSNILSCNEEVTLRGIGNIADELDCLTGEVTERIAEVTFRGALNEGWGQIGDSAIQDKTCLFVYYTGLPSTPSDDLKMISDKYIIKNGFSSLLNTDEEMVHAYKDKAVYIRVLKSKLSTQNVTGFKEWLSQNPFTIQYKLKTETVKTVDLSDNHVYSYKDVTHYDCSSAEGSLVPTLSIDVPTNLPAVVTRQRATIQELEKENVALKNEIEETANSSVNGDLELLSSQFELDFRLFEIEMNLDMPMMATMRGVKSMAMTVYQQAKTLILAGKYERENMEYKLNRYKEAGRITVEEYEELIALMDARELVD